MISGNCQGLYAMWTELTRADIERVKGELKARRSEMLARHAAELTALDVDEAEITVIEEAIEGLIRKFNIGSAEIVQLKAVASWSSYLGNIGEVELMIGDTLNGAGTHVAVLDGTVFDALGQLQGKHDAEFVARMITMFMETALVLLIRLKEGVANGDFVALHHASHELKSCSVTMALTHLRPIANGWKSWCAKDLCRIQLPRSKLSVSNIGGQKPL
jgi:HPt (histidine-containing phosphotransfer) domain-containing protein